MDNPSLGKAWVILPAPFGKAWKIHCQSCPSNFKENGNPPIRFQKACFFLGMSLVLCTWDIPRKSQAFLQADGRHITYLGRPVAMCTLLQHIKMLIKASLLPRETWNSGSFYHRFMVYSCVSILVYGMSLIL